MTTFLRFLLGLAAGLALAFAGAVAVEGVSAVVHPFPPGFDGNIPAHVQRYPAWVLALVVVLWSATGAAGTWAAARIGRRWAGLAVALLLAAAVLLNLAMLPYAGWFKGAMPLAFVAACAWILRGAWGR